MSRACAVAGQAGGPVDWRRRRVRGTSGTGRRQVTATASGERATCAANNTGTDIGVEAGRVNAARLPISSRRACSSASSRSIDDNRRARVGGHGHDHSLPPRDQCFDAGRVEHVGAVFHRSADSGGLTALGPAFGQRKRQVHAGGVGVYRHRSDLQDRPTPTWRRDRCCRVREGSARPTPPEPAGDGPAIGWG